MTRDGLVIHDGGATHDGGMIHDEIGRHLAEAGSCERAAVPLGLYLAWCANLDLLSDSLREHALVLRVRYRDVGGSELAIAGCGGTIADAHLNEEGRAFTTAYYPRFRDDLATEFGADVHAVRDDWASYDRIAPRLTRALMDFRRGRLQAPSPSGSRGRWWRVWRR